MTLRKIAISLLLTLTATFLNAEEQSYVQANKKATYDYATHMGTITLDSYVTGAEKVKRSAIPADIILVLDFSSSMKDNNKNTMLKNAATDFIDKMVTSANDNNVDHRIGVITFGSGAHIKTDFLSIKGNTTNVNTLKSIVSATNPATGETKTRYDLALLLTKNMLIGGTQYNDISTTGDASQPDHNYGIGYLNPDLVLSDKYCTKGTLKGQEEGKTTFIIFLTDGEPTGKTTLGNMGQFYGQSSINTIDTPGNGGGGDVSTYGSNWDNTYEFGIANHAIRSAYYIKNTKKAQIYSIKIGKVSGTGKENLAVSSLKAICSQYPKAERYRQKYWGTAATGTEPFFQNITSVSQATISGAFEKISSSIEKIVNIQYGAETIMTDFINNAYFQMPSIVDPADPWASIKVYENNCTGVATDGQRTFGTIMTPKTAADGIVIVINKADPSNSDSNDQLIIYGYDYSANWCGVDKDKKAHGNRLIVEMPFEFKGGEEVPGALETNTTDSGIYPAQRDKDGNIIRDEKGNPVYDDKPEADYPVPVIKFCQLVIERTELDPGESAIYEISSDGKVVGRVTLGGVKGQTKVSKTLYGLPGGDEVKYTVTETGWNWAYNREAAQTKVVDTPSVPVVFTFGGSHRTGGDDDPQEMHNHDEEYVINVIEL